MDSTMDLKSRIDNIWQDSPASRKNHPKMLMDQVLVTPLKRLRHHSRGFKSTRSKSLSHTSTRKTRIVTNRTPLPAQKENAYTAGLLTPSTPGSSLSRVKRRIVSDPSVGEVSLERSRTLPFIKQPSKPRYSPTSTSCYIPATYQNTSQEDYSMHNEARGNQIMSVTTDDMHAIPGLHGLTRPTLSNTLSHFVDNVQYALDEEVKARRKAEDQHLIELRRRIAAEAAVEQLKLERAEYFSQRMIPRRHTLLSP